MPRVSAGLLMYRIRDGTLEVLLGHPGGPFFRLKDRGAWTIPKGELEQDESPLDAARREFEEETSFRPTGPYKELTPIQQKGGKHVHAWAFEADCHPESLQSNEFSMQWPPRSGHYAQFPELDQFAYFDLKEARSKIKASQWPLVRELDQWLRKEDTSRLR